MKIFVSQADLDAITHVKLLKSLQRVQPRQQHPIQLHEQYHCQKPYRLKRQQCPLRKIPLQENNNIKIHISPHPVIDLCFIWTSAASSLLNMETIKLVLHLVLLKLTTSKNKELVHPKNYSKQSLKNENKLPWTLRSTTLLETLKHIQGRPRSWYEIPQTVKTQNWKLKKDLPRAKSRTRVPARKLVTSSGRRWKTPTLWSSPLSIDDGEVEPKRRRITRSGTEGISRLKVQVD